MKSLEFGLFQHCECFAMVTEFSDRCRKQLRPAPGRCFLHLSSKRFVRPGLVCFSRHAGLTKIAEPKLSPHPVDSAMSGQNNRFLESSPLWYPTRLNPHRRYEMTWKCCSMALP